MFDRHMWRLNYEIDRQREQTRRYDEREKEKSQLRMQAIEAAIKQSNRTGFLAGENYILNLADLYVHYCLTGEHQLPGKK